MMLVEKAETLPNRLLAALGPEDFRALQPDLRRTRLVRGQALVERGGPASTLYFIEQGVASVMAGEEERAVQVAMIGREGLAGAPGLLAQVPESADVVMQFPGSALAIPLELMRAHLATRPALRDMCLRYLHVYMGQLAETASVNARATLIERCAHWLVTACDRMDQADLPVTHEALSAMLGVRRPGVTIAIATLQDEGMIRATRGSIKVLDRAGLEACCNRSGRSIGRAPIQPLMA